MLRQRRGSLISELLRSFTGILPSTNILVVTKFMKAMTTKQNFILFRLIQVSLPAVYKASVFMGLLIAAEHPLKALCPYFFCLRTTYHQRTGEHIFMICDIGKCYEKSVNHLYFLLSENSNSHFTDRSNFLSGRTSFRIPPLRLQVLVLSLRVRGSYYALFSYI